MNIAAATERALAHRFALPTYVAARIVMVLTLPVEIQTTLLSDFANVALILMAAAQYRASCKIEAEIDAIADAHEGVDAETIRQSV